MTGSKASSRRPWLPWTWAEGGAGSKGEWRSNSSSGGGGRDDDDGHDGVRAAMDAAAMEL